MIRLHIKNNFELMKKTLLIILLSTVYLFGQSNFELKKINFVGNKSFSATELNSVIALRESPNVFSQVLFSLIGLGEEAVYFDSLSLNTEMLRLKSFYFNNGFFNASIQEKHSINIIDETAEIIFKIYEGNSYRYNDFNIYGLDSLKGDTKKNVNEILTIDTTENYNYDNISNINNYVTNILRDNGYMFSGVDSTLIFIDSVKNIVDTKIYFNLGKKYTISDIKIEKSGEGIDEVEAELIDEIVGIEKGETYSRYNIELGQERLYNTKLFNVAIINSVVSDTIGNQVPLKISTEIGKMYQASPEVIMNNEDDRFNLGLGIGFSKRNFLGSARILTLNSSIAAQNITEFIQNMSVENTQVIGYADLRLMLDQPFIFGKKIDTRYELYTTLQKRRNEYNTIASGFKVSLNFELPPYVYLTSLVTSWNVERLSVLYQKDYINSILRYVIAAQDSAQVDSTISEYVRNSINTLLSVSFGANKTNDFIFPTSGYRANIQLANANLEQYLYSKIFNSELNSPLYYKAQIDFIVYPNIYYSKENSIGMKIRAGNIFVYEGIETAVPYNQRFTSGGSNSLRGWQSRELVPDFNSGDLDLSSLSPSELESIFLDKATPGGLFQLEGSIETRNRLIGSIGTALFVDYGNTWVNINAFRYDEIAVSAGFGLRYYTDFIPFRIDFAVKIYDPNSSKSIWDRPFWNDLIQIHFAIGEAF